MIDACYSFFGPSLICFFASVFIGEPYPIDPTLEAEKPIVEIGQCDPVDKEDRPFRWTHAKRREVRDRLDYTFRSQRAAPIIRAYVDVIAYRESYGGTASVRHTLGKNENGLGPLGLSIRFQGRFWSGDPDPDFCTPEVSAVVAHAFFWVAYDNYQARSIADLQAIYGGHWSKSTLWPSGRIVRRANQWYKEKPRLCAMMKKRGYNCEEKITARTLGRRVHVSKRLDIVAKLLARHKPSTGS